nr:hypothetical protein [Asanoa hainanensis]
MFDRGEFVAVVAGGGCVVGDEGADGVVDDLVCVGEEVDQGTFHRLFDFVGVESVDPAACFGAVAVAAPAGVVPVAPGAAVRRGADVLAAAGWARDLAGEGVVGGVGRALADALAALGEDALRVVELTPLDDRLVCVDHSDPAEALLAEVLPVGDHILDRALRPQGAGTGTQSAVVEHIGDGACAEAVLRVEVEDQTDGDRLRLVDDVVVGLGVLGVAERDPAAGKEALGRLAFHAGDDAVDDDLAFEFREYAEHLDQHPTDRGRGVEWFGGTAEDHFGVFEVVEERDEVTQSAGEAVDSVDQQGVEHADPRGTQHLLKVFAVSRGAGGVVGIDLHDLPVARL